MLEEEVYGDNSPVWDDDFTVPQSLSLGPSRLSSPLTPLTDRGDSLVATARWYDHLFLVNVNQSLICGLMWGSGLCSQKVLPHVVQLMHKVPCFITLFYFCKLDTKGYNINDIQIVSWKLFNMNKLFCITPNQYFV